MIWIAYATFAAALLWLAVGAGARDGALLRGLLRQIVVADVAVLAAIIVFVFINLLGEHGNPSDAPAAYLLLIAGGVGSVLYGAGLREPVNRTRMRRLGWLVLLPAFLVPSTLTLALPLASLLVITLKSADESLPDGETVQHDLGGHPEMMPR